MSPRSVVVVGSGAAGVAAAVGAATSGARVTMLEAADRLGGTTATSGGGIWIPANPWSAAAGSVDSIEEGITYLHGIQAIAGGDPDVAVAFVHEGLRVTRLIEERTPVRWQHINGFRDYHPELEGGSLGGRSLEMKPVEVSHDILKQLRPDPYKLPLITIAEGELPTLPDEAELARRKEAGVTMRGRGIVAALAVTFLEHGGTILTRRRATKLITRDGVVVGVEADGEEFAGDVILASGGFERNVGLVNAYLRGPMLGPAGPPTNQGDAVLMGMSASAVLANMDDAWWVASMHVPGETIDGAPFHRMLFVEASRPGGLVVDQTGRRFANECVNYYGFARALQERDTNTFAQLRSPSWIIMDSTRRPLMPLSALGPGDPDPPWLVKADSLGGLATQIGLSPAVLDETVGRFNAQAANGRDDDFGRGDYLWDEFSSMGDPLRPVAKPPFYALEIVPGCSGTKGGIDTDEYGRARHLDGGVVEGLFAAGNAAAYPFGSGFPGGGATIGPALVFGWRAGETAAAGAA